MTLNKQLLCVSLLLLSIPWAGCQYLREMDTALKDGQRETLQASAMVIAQSLAGTPGQLDPHGELTADQGQPHHAIYCHPLSVPVRADGYFEEWDEEGSAVPWTDYTATDNTHSLRYRCGVYNNQLALVVLVNDAEVIYNNPTLPLADNGDRLLLATGEREYILTAMAPGAITTRYYLNPHTTYRESRISAAWIDNEQGYQIEINMPLKLAKQRLSFAVVDETTQGSTTYGPLQNRDPAPRFVYQAPGPEQALATFKQQGIRLRLSDTRGLLTASVGSPEPEQKNSAHWLLSKLYRAILKDETEQYPRYSNGIDLSARSEFQSALRGEPAGRWYHDPSHNDRQLLSTAIPIRRHDDEVIAVLFAEQSSERTAALTDRAFNRLFGLSFGIIAVSILILLSYASWLSWRIRRLSKATRQALDDRNHVNRNMPESQARDEIGALTRNYAELMKRIAEYTDYLQTLSRKLSHELRTPLAIVHSSLDNLAQQPLDATSQTYQQRAKDGALRLGNILTAMSEARRVEESIEQAEPEPTNISALLAELSRAYRDVYPRHTITTEGIDPDDQPVWLTAVPDLLVQLLDKLMDNAAGFCPPCGTITLGLNRDGSSIRFFVSNDGPLLPETMQSQLFDNMVSLREQDDKQIHLGLGLHIVNLIAAYHGGAAMAENRADNSGVIFSVCFS